MAFVFSFWCCLLNQPSGGSIKKVPLQHFGQVLVPATLAYWALGLLTETFFGNLGLLLVFGGASLDAVLLGALGAAIPCVLLRNDWTPSFEMVVTGLGFTVPAIAIAWLTKLIVSHEWAYLFPGFNVIIYMSTWALAAAVSLAVRDQIVQN